MLLTVVIQSHVYTYNQIIFHALTMVIFDVPMVVAVLEDMTFVMEMKNA